LPCDYGLGDRKLGRPRFATMTAADHTESPKRKKAKITEPETVPINQVETKLRSQREREDDKYIAYLEGKLGKGKKGAEDDGLDGITIVQSIDLFV
jgi:hypothetical protein